MLVTVGFRWQEVRHVLGQHGITTMEVTACEPARLLCLRSITAPVPVAVTHELMTDAQHTRLSFAIDGRLGRSASLVGPLAKVALDRHLRASCQRLRDLLERSRPR